MADLDTVTTNIVDELLHERERCRIETFFPDTGPLRRELYPRHMEFFKAGRTYNQRLFMAANRVGKSIAGAYETACHLTGRYPSWWEGRRFLDHAPTGIACNTTATKARDINQRELLGPYNAIGTGMIYGDSIVEWTRKPGVTEAVENIYIQHEPTGGVSKLGFFSYDQGRKKVEGLNLDLIWHDEEVPYDIYTESLMRVMTLDGFVYCTYTPIQGLTEVTMNFQPHLISIDADGNQVFKDELSDAIVAKDDTATIDDEEVA